MELAENFFSQKSVLSRGRSVTPFFGWNAPFPPPKKNCLSSEANIGLFVQNFNNGSTSQLRSIFHFGKYKIFFFVSQWQCVHTLSSCTYWPQLRCAPIKFGRCIKLNTINVKVLYKQADMGFAAEAGFFLGGERERFAQKKGAKLHPRATVFEKKNLLKAQYIL